jgi:oligoendopeptidase F
MAQLAAFEFYTQMRTDRKAAWENYYKLCQVGGSAGYLEVIERHNLRNTLQDGSVKEILAPIFEELGL